MQRIILLVGLVLAVGVLMPASARPAAGGSDLPLKGSLFGTSAHNLGTGLLHSDATGEITHFGLTTVVQDSVMVPTGPPGNPFASFNWTSGTWTLTAANGDQMSGASVGTCIRGATTVRCVLDYTASDGTGRFQDATATFTVTAEVTRIALEFPGPVSISTVAGELVGTLSW